MTFATATDAARLRRPPLAAGKERRPPPRTPLLRTLFGSEPLPGDLGDDFVAERVEGVGAVASDDESQDNKQAGDKSHAAIVAPAASNF